MDKSELLKNPKSVMIRLRDKYRRWNSGDVLFHPDNLPETRDPTRFSAILHDDWMTLSEEVEDLEATRLLEIGCNYGRWIPWLSDYAEDYYAIEPVKEAIEIAESQYPNVHFEQTVASDLPFEDNHFDAVVSWAVLMHIPPNKIRPSIEEIKRVTAPNGTIILGEEVGKDDDEIVFRRTISEWEELLSPRKLESMTHRQGMTNDLVHDRRAMRFK